MLPHVCANPAKNADGETPLALVCYTGRMKTYESFGGFSTWGVRGMKVRSNVNYFSGANVALGLIACLGLKDAFGNHWGYGLFELAWVMMFFGIAVYAQVGVWQKGGK
jgi:hypothetical protein